MKSQLRSPLGVLEIEWSEAGLGRLRLSANALGKTDAQKAQIYFPLPLDIKEAIADFFDARPVKFKRFDTTTWTDFQKKIYRELQKVKTGQTITYADLAENIGSPGASRAVGTAMKKNPIPILIPCHRVLPSTLTSKLKVGAYSFGNGAETKARLLNFERLATKKNQNPFWEFDWTSASKKLAEHIPIAKRSYILRARLENSQSLFHTLARSIVGQQIHPKAATAVWQRLLTAFKDEAGFANATLPQMQACGASARKAESIQELARRSINGKIPKLAQAIFMSNDDLIRELTKVKGIGPWTVEMFLIFHLGRQNVWPVADFGMRRGVEKFLGLRQSLSAEKFLKLGDRFAPYKSAASLFFWDYHGLNPG